MAQVEWTPLSKIVEFIKQLCAERRTGTLFMVSDENFMAQILIEGGDIVALMHRNRRGRDALAIVGNMKYAKYRFDNAFAAPSARHDLTTRDIFDYLGGATPNSASPVATSGIPSSGVVTADIRATMQKVLMRYIGPMAEIICADHFEQATDVRVLAGLLADEIPDRAEAAKFAAEIARTLNIAPA